LFQGLSADPAHVTNKGDDDAWGAGVRLGWTGNITNNLTVGATAASKIYMQEFDEYAGLFAEQGDFDIPANFGVGIAFKATPSTTIAFDVQSILYGDVAAINNAGPTADEFLGGLTQVISGGAVTCAAVGVTTCKQLGNDDGYGFGWDDIVIYKLGVEHAYNSQWTFRAGFNYGENPIDEKENLFNIIAPGVVEKHATVGFTYSPDAASEISLAYTHAFREDQSYTYTNPITAPGFGPQSYTADIGMSQNALEVSYGVKF
jgi:long-chain fatty acid transport protein